MNPFSNSFARSDERLGNDKRDRRFSLSDDFDILLCRHPSIPEEELRNSVLELNPKLVDSLSLKSALGLPADDSYFIAMLCHNNEAILPNILGELLKLVFIVRSSHGNFDNVYVSIYESGSEDRTPEILLNFQKDLLNLRVPHTLLIGGSVKHHLKSRIEFLANLRNLALEPLLTSPKKWDHLLYVNDIITCASSLAMLLASRIDQTADMACAMDYTVNENDDVVFYDIWVGIDMDGQHFSGGEPHIHERNGANAMSNLRPFQVFSCWGGAVSVSASVIQSDGIRFRTGGPLECPSSECEIFCRDLWSIGRGRIITNPNVITSYDMNSFQRVYKPPLREKENTYPLDFSGPPALVTCCGIDSPFENEVDFMMNCVESPWLWWYSIFTTPKARLGQLHAIIPSPDEAVEISLKDIKHFSSNGINCAHLRPKKIPRSIAFAWKSAELMSVPLMFFLNILTWSYRHPCYDLHIFSDRLTTELLSELLENDILNSFKLPTDSGERADLARYAYMLEYGGIYADMDTFPLLSLENLLLEEDEFVIGLESDFREPLSADLFVYARQRGVSQHCFATRAWSPILRATIYRVLKNLNDRANLVYPFIRSRNAGSVRQLSTILSTGSGPFSAEVLSEKNSRTVRLVGLNVFSGLMNGELVSYMKNSEGEELTYVNHHRYGSWLDVSGSYMTKSDVQPATVANTLKFGGWLGSAGSIENKIDRLDEWVPLLSGEVLFGPSRTDAFGQYGTIWTSSEPRHTVIPVAPTFLWLRGKEHMPPGSERGCLELRRGQGPGPSDEISDGVIWRACWPGKDEMDIVYMVLSHQGILTVYTANQNCCGDNKNKFPRRILWATDQARDRVNDSNRISLKCGGRYRLALTASEQLIVSQTSKTVQCERFHRLDQKRGTCPIESHISVLAHTSLEYAENLCWENVNCRSVEFSSEMGEFSHTAWLCATVSVPEYRTKGWQLSVKAPNKALEQEEKLRCTLENHDPESCKFIMTPIERTLLRTRCACSVK